MSPILPKSKAPSGLKRKPRAKAPKLASSDAIGSSDGKKTLATIGARIAYV